MALAQQPLAVEPSSLEHALLHYMNGRALHVMCEFAQEPGSIRALVVSCKALWAPHGKNLVAKKLKCELDACLATVKNRLASQVQTKAFPGENAWLDFSLSIQSLFPDGPLFDEYYGNFRPQVLISGSSTLQAALGVRWEGSDLDIFCTWKEAPRVRQWLKDCGLSWVGCATRAANRYNITENSTIDHVEHLYPLPAAVRDPTDRWADDLWIKTADAQRQDCLLYTSPSPRD